MMTSSELLLIYAINSHFAAHQGSTPRGLVVSTEVWAGLDERTCTVAADGSADKWTFQGFPVTVNRARPGQWVATIARA